MNPEVENGLKRIVVGSSSENSSINPHRKYRVRIGPRWYEGSFAKRWFGWLFLEFGETGMQLNLIDEVFEMPRVVLVRAPAKPAPPPVV
jgi:hypothetical protein